VTGAGEVEGDPLAGAQLGDQAGGEDTGALGLVAGLVDGAAQALHAHGGIVAPGNAPRKPPRTADRSA
jgi:hypothetical protein